MVLYDPADEAGPHGEDDNLQLRRDGETDAIKDNKCSP